MVYCKYLGKMPSEWIKEAEDEEDQKIRLRNRSVKTRLLNFKDFLNENNYSAHTRSSTLTIVRSFYSEFDIELPRMRFKKNLPKEDISAIPTKKDIRKALNIANPKYKAIILLMLSSGMRAGDIRSLSYQDFLTSLYDYFKLPDKDALNIDVLSKRVNEIELPVPTWDFISEKTENPTITFSTPESVEAIIDCSKIGYSGKINGIKLFYYCIAHL